VAILPTTEGAQPSLVRIIHDDAAGGEMAARYLLARGHRRCGYVGDSDVPAFTGTTRDHKLSGFRRTLVAAGAALPDAYVGLAPFGREPARRQALRLLDLPQPPTAIFAGSDTQAMGVLLAARERGLAVPGDLAVMGFDDVEHAEVLGLTTIAQQLKESGRRAVELLLGLLAGNEPETHELLLPFALVERATV
jgi:DNA-binding LacI/PurR family transcriptional regulator